MTVITLLTVPHTGTHFVAALLRDHGIEVEQKHYSDSKSPVVKNFYKELIK